MRRTRRRAFVPLPGIRRRLLWAAVIAVSGSGLLMAGLPWLLALAAALTGSSGSGSANAVLTGSPQVMGSVLTSLGELLANRLPMIVAIVVAAIGIGSLVGLALPARGPATVVATAVLLLPLALSLDDARWLLNWMARPLLPRPPPDPVFAAAIVWQSLPVVAILVRGAVASVDDRVWQAARRDGLTLGERWRWLWWPRLWPVWAAAGLVVLVRTVLTLSAQAQPPAGDTPWAVTLARLLLWAACLAVLVGVVPVIGRSLFPSAPAPVAGRGLAPDGSAGLPGRPLLQTLTTLIGIVPILILFSIALGGLDAIAASRSPVDVLDLVWPAALDLSHLRASAADPVLRRWLVLAAVGSLTFAVVAVVLAWPAAWALSRLAPTGVGLRWGRALLLTGLLLPAGFLAGAVPPWLAGAAGTGVRWWLPALLLVAALAAATATLEALIRRQAGGADAERIRDERAALAGARPPSLVTAWQDPALRSALVVTACLAFALTWQGITALLAMLEPSSFAAGPPALRAARAVLLAVPPWAAAMAVALVLARIPRAGPAVARPPVAAPLVST